MTREELKAIGWFRRCFKWPSVVEEIAGAIDALEKHVEISRGMAEDCQRRAAQAQKALADHQADLEKSKEGNRTLLKFIVRAHGLKLKLVTLSAFLFVSSAWTQFPPPFQHNFFSTNLHPVVQVTAGTNAQITFSTTGTDARSYRVDVPLQTVLTNNLPLTLNQVTNPFAPQPTLHANVDGSAATAGTANTSINVYGYQPATNGAAIANSQLPATLTNKVSQASFTANFTIAGTNVVISPTNGNLQKWVLTNASWAAMDAANTNDTETFRVNIYGSNTLTWTTTTLSNSSVLGPSNFCSSVMFDHEEGTNLWWGYRLR